MDKKMTGKKVTRRQVKMSFVALYAVLMMLVVFVVNPAMTTAQAAESVADAATGSAVAAESASKNDSGTTVKVKKVSYKDVKKKTKYRKAILRVGKYGALNHLAKSGKKFRPAKLIREGEFTEILTQLYGSEVVGQNSWSKKIVTQKWATKKLTAVAKELGVTMSWSGGTPKGKVSRGQACQYISDMMSTSERLLPENVR